MNSNDLRKKYINFFKNHKKYPHTQIQSAPLVPSKEQQLSGKEEILFTSAGMQPLIPFFLGKPYPGGSKRLVDYQKCLRTDDIEEVGDLVHHTFFEMLGNWSLGDYWKKEAIQMSFEFLTNELEIPIDKLAVTVFAGDKDASKDTESANAWEKMGISKERIFFLGKEDNWWPTPKKDPETGETKLPKGPCGPDSEMFYWTGKGKPEGSPKTDSRWVEIWNDVFMQFNHLGDGVFEELVQKNVDTGMGMERTLTVLNGSDDNYRTDLFLPIIGILEEDLNVTYGRDPQIDQHLRIISDHIRASVFLLIDGIVPSNKLQGYILRRLLRRSAVKIFQITGNLEFFGTITKVSNKVLDIYSAAYKHDVSTVKKDQIYAIILDEMNKFGASLSSGFKKLEEADRNNLKTLLAFDLYQSHGFPFEIAKELIEHKGGDFNTQEFNQIYKAHQELSRAASAGMFKGGLADHSDQVVKLHTATHLLHQALRAILGNHVSQKGSNITGERLRFDFSHPQKMTPDEIKAVEELVNKKITEDLPIAFSEMDKNEALHSGALAFFGEKYESRVKVYTMGNFSKEICGGPHVEHTNQLGNFKIIKEESAGSGVRRVYATVS